MERKGLYVLQERSNSRLNTRKPVSVKQRNTKQLMEKKRRARINSCLDTLKSLVLKNTNQDVSQFTKLEKADVLEMVVKYMENMQKSKSPRASNNIENQCARPEGENRQCASQSLKRTHPKTFNGHRKSPKRRRLLMDLTNLPETSDQDENSNPFSFSDSDSDNPIIKSESRSVFAGDMSTRCDKNINFKKMCGFDKQIAQESIRSRLGHERNRSSGHVMVAREQEIASLNIKMDENSNDSQKQIFKDSELIENFLSDCAMEDDNVLSDDFNVLDNSCEYDESVNVMPADVTETIWRPW